MIWDDEGYFIVMKSEYIVDSLYYLDITAIGFQHDAQFRALSPAFIRCHALDTMPHFIIYGRNHWSTQQNHVSLEIFAKLKVGVHKLLFNNCIDIHCMAFSCRAIS